MNNNYTIAQRNALVEKHLWCIDTVIRKNRPLMRAAQLEYDSTMLPYLGFWATGGGYRGDVNCALEPTNGYYDGIPNARQHNACPVLTPDETWNFTLSIQLYPLV